MKHKTNLMLIFNSLQLDMSVFALHTNVICRCTFNYFSFCSIQFLSKFSKQFLEKKTRHLLRKETDLQGIPILYSPKVGVQIYNNNYRFVHISESRRIVLSKTHLIIHQF